jgi:spore germination protein YaaH
MDTPSRMSRNSIFEFRRAVSLLLLIAVAAWAAPKAPHSAPSASKKSVAEAALAGARQRVLDATPLAMFYYSNDSLGLASLEEHANVMTLVAPQCYELDRLGGLHGQLPAGVGEVTHRAGLPLMPLVINPGFDRATAHTLLHNAKAQERAAKYLATLALRNKYVGWQLDLENIDRADQLAYTRFVARVAARLHHDHLLLSVAVVPRFSDTYPDPPATEFRTGEWGAAFDFRGLGSVADFLVLMAYDQHTSQTPPGPVAGYDWTKAAVDYAVSTVPPDKLLLGIPFYGREWVQTASRATAHTFTYKDLKLLLEDSRTERHWDEISQTSWFQLQDGKTLCTAWFDDAHSLREKLNLVQVYHLRGYAPWRLGVEDPGVWDAMTPHD